MKKNRVNVLKEVVKKLIYSGWDIKSNPEEAYLMYGPYRLIVPAGSKDSLEVIMNRFIVCICEIEGVKEL